MKTPHELGRFEIRLSGTGGQGIITLGRILGNGLSLGIVITSYSIHYTKLYESPSGP